MALFQEPPPDLETLERSEEAPDIPNRILYYLGVLLTDPQVIELVLTMRVKEMAGRYIGNATSVHTRVGSFAATALQ